MSTLFISLLTLVLILVSVFVVLIVLMQRTSQSGGMGAALGGGAAESAFGSETNNILTKGTIYGIIAYFVIALGLYLMYQSAAADREEAGIDASSLISSGITEETADTVTSVVDAETIAETVQAENEELFVEGEAAAAIEAATENVEGTIDAVVESIEASVEEAASEIPASVEDFVVEEDVPEVN